MLCTDTDEYSPTKTYIAQSRSLVAIKNNKGAQRSSNIMTYKEIKYNSVEEDGDFLAR